MNKLRVTFKKCEGMRYVGHLDILRTFSRILRRFDFPLKYSEGFNPHPVMTFALPTGVGVTSDCEIVDIGITSDVDTDKFISEFNKHSLQNSIEALSAEITEESMPIIEKAEYLIEIINSNAITADELSDALSIPEIMIEKKSKKQIKNVNIKDYIISYEISEIKDNTVILKMVLSAGNTKNIKPALVVDALSSVCEKLNPQSVKPHRLKYYFENL